ncbi:MAG: SAF domain-containing protein [Clostridiales Family XIII bacterium]|jgi:hypothetical protein|nr:SAF domain-containing protein [Clostridiales Family XIII bacterium]
MIGKYRKWIGLSLVVAAVLSLVAWEVKGRETVLMDEVLIANEAIPEGETLTASMFRSVSVPGNAVIEDVVVPARVDDIEGQVSATPILAGGQLSSKHLRNEREETRTDDSFFVIRREWIYMRSSALRRGDYADIVSEDGGRVFGRYKIAFVKNAEEKEVSDATDGGVSLMTRNNDSRADATSGIDHVEIITDLKTYMRIKSYAESKAGPSLILVQREERK